MTKTAIIKIRVTPEAKAAFDAAAKANGKTASKVLRAAVERFIGRYASRLEQSGGGK